MRHAQDRYVCAVLMAWLFSALHPLAGVWERGLISRLRPSNPVCSVAFERSASCRWACRAARRSVALAVTCVLA